MTASVDTERPAKKRPVALVVILAVLAAVGIGVAVTLMHGGGKTTVSGDLTLVAQMPRGAAGSGVLPVFSSGKCSGYGGYSDIDAGAEVDVFNEAGTLIATGALGAGSGTDMMRTVQAGNSIACVFPISVPNVPAGAQLYQIQVSHRGKTTVAVSDDGALHPHLKIGS